MSPEELMAHLKKHFRETKNHELSETCSSILEAAGERDRLRTGGVYDITDPAQPRFVDKICSGGYWKQGQNQRRWIDKYFPGGKRGRPSTKEADLFFVSILATQFARLTGKPSSANYETPDIYTDFGRFAVPILRKAGITSPHNALKAFLKARNSLGGSTKE